MAIYALMLSAAGIPLYNHQPQFASVHLGLSHSALGVLLLAIRLVFEEALYALDKNAVSAPVRSEFGWHLIKRRRPSDPSVRAMRSVNLDVGEVIQIEEWLSDGTASVKYRGAQWTVIQRPGNPPIPGAYRVAELVGNRLLVDKI